MSNQTIKKKKGSAEIQAGCLLFSGRPSGINGIGSRSASAAGTCSGGSLVAASFRAAGRVPETSALCGAQQHPPLACQVVEKGSVIYVAEIRHD